MRLQYSVCLAIFQQCLLSNMPCPEGPSSESHMCLNAHFLILQMSAKPLFPYFFVSFPSRAVILKFHTYKRVADKIPLRVPGRVREGFWV